MARMFPSSSSSSAAAAAAATIVALLFCLTVTGLDAAAARQNNPVPREDKTPFSFDDIFNSTYRAKGFSGRWIDGTHFLFRDAYGNLKNYSAETKQEVVFVANTTFAEIKSGTYFVSDDSLYVLFAYNVTSLWRHSYNAKYAVYEVATRAWTFLPTGSTSAAVNATLQYCNWSPSEHSLAFVYNNDIYYQSTPGIAAERITTSGVPLYIFNGVPDWLYEEDVVSERVAHYWSPTSQFIVYAEFNDTEVPLQDWPWYGAKSRVHPRTIQVAYPKAGDVRDGQAGPNTKVKLFVVDKDSLAAPKQLLPPINVPVEHYYLQVEWRSDETVMVTWANRVQNQSFSTIYNATDDAPANSITGQKNLDLIATGGWIEVPPATPYFINGGSEYLTVLPVNVAAGDPWRNLVKVSAPYGSDGVITYLMNATQEVEYIVGYNPNNGLVYFVSTNGDPLERHVMRLNASAPGPQVPTCLTCGESETCRYTSATFSPSAEYFFLYCYGPDVPTYSLRKTDNYTTDYVMFEDNHELKANLARKLLPTRTFLNVDLGEGITGRAELFLPPNHVEGQKHPLFVYAYAGPGSQRVMKTFPNGGSTARWLLHLKSSHNIAVMSLDARGSIAAGDKKKFEMYRKLGLVEIQDQISGGQLFRNRSDIDETVRSAIFGWSYGGGVAAHVIGDTSTTFTCGISVAPVTTKTYYDTAYTERYLGLATPSDNELGYNRTDVMSKAANFKDKKFMIAHGTADDNVHFMHTVQLISALSEAGVSFRQNLYMDQNHGISSPGQSRHLYASMTDFLLRDCWPNNVAPTVPPTVSPTVSSAKLILPGSLATLLTLVLACLNLTIRAL